MLLLCVSEHAWILTATSCSARDPTPDTSLTPTALTPLQGSFLLQSHELFGLIASYGITDRVQVTGIAVVFPGEDEHLFAVDLKARLVEAGRLRLALHGGIALVTDSTDPALVPNAGLIATACLDRECHSLVNGYAGVLMPMVRGEEAIMVASAGMVVGLSKRFKLLAEVGTGADDIDNWSDSPSEAMAVWYGLRVTGSRFGLDFGLVRPLDESFSDDIPMGLPWLKVTARVW